MSSDTESTGRTNRERITITIAPDALQMLTRMAREERIPRSRLLERIIVDRARDLELARMDENGE